MNSDEKDINTVETEDTVAGVAENGSAENTVKVSALYKIVCTVIAALFIFLEGYAIVVLLAGGFTYGGSPLCVSGFIDTVSDFKDYIQFSQLAHVTDLSLMVNYVLILAGCVTCVGFAIAMLVMAVKTIIALVKYLKTLGAADLNGFGFKAFEVTANKSLKVTAYAYIVAVMLGFGLTSAALALAIIGLIVYFSVNVFEMLFKNGEFGFNGKESILDLTGRFLSVLLAVACILVIKDAGNMFAVINNIVTMVLQELEGKQMTICLCRNIFLPVFVMIVNVFWAVIVMSLAMRKGYVSRKSAYGAGGKQFSKAACRGIFIAILVLTIITYAIDCVGYSLIAKYEFGDYVGFLKSYVAPILASVGGIILNPVYGIYNEYYSAYGESNGKASTT